ncbi:MAG TPA: OB-fold nucleic acid binding domain-containing protein [Candidatus Nanoarchaeia archaeon]|nr:OB-fold nucleic acid binding domain-containing protein [Candidatus Nanoarchaeia archaeon]
MERSTAYILWLSSLNGKQMQKQELEFSPSYIEIDNKKISRINSIAVVANKNQKEQYASLTLDDGSAQIRVKTWQDDTKIISNVSIGDTVLVIGKIKEYNEELYLAPEVVRQQDYTSLLLRQFQLLKQNGKPELIPLNNESTDFEEQPNTQPLLKEERVQSSSESNRQKIISSLSSLDTESGALISEVIKSSGIQEEQANNILNELLQEGEIFKISNDRIKIT